MKLTVFHDGQFWVGIIERTTEQGLFVSRHLFGAEPQNEEVLAFVNQQLLEIIRSQTISIPTTQVSTRAVNPKRRSRLVAQEMRAPISNKAHAALQAQLEANKKGKQVQSKAQKEEAAARRRQIAREKARKRHRGR